MNELVTMQASTLEAQMNYAKALAVSDLLPHAYRGKPANVLVALALGEALGLPPTAALYGINVIQSKPTLSAETMRAVVLSHGHRFDVEEFTETEARVAVARKERPADVSRFSFTMDDAKRAGLLGGNYDKYPKAMLLARATSTACRAIFPDVLAGVSYTPEELDEPAPVERLTVVEPVVDAWRAAQVEAREDVEDVEPVEDLVAPVFVPGNIHGPAARAWIQAPASEDQRKYLGRLVREAGYPDTRTFLDSPHARQALGGRPSSPLVKGHASTLIDYLREFLDADVIVEATIDEIDEDEAGENYEAGR